MAARLWCDGAPCRAASQGRISQSGVILKVMTAGITFMSTEEQRIAAMRALVSVTGKQMFLVGLRMAVQLLLTRGMCARPGEVNVKRVSPHTRDTSHDRCFYGYLSSRPHSLAVACTRSVLMTVCSHVQARNVAVLSWIDRD